MKLKIIKSPGFHCYDKHNILPPLGVGKIVAFLKGEGFLIQQKDLNILNYAYAKFDRQRILSLLLRKERLLKFLTGGHDAKLEDLACRYLRDVDGAATDALLISVFAEDFCSSMLALLIGRHFKNKFKNRIVIIGGESLHNPYIYNDIDAFGKTGAFDYYLLGPGEESLLMLLRRIDRKTAVRGDIPGVCCMHEKRVYRNVTMNVSRLIAPCFDGLPLHQYEWEGGAFFHKISAKKFANIPILTLPFQMTLGCPHHCAFCIFANKRVGFMDAREAVRSLKEHVDRREARHFFFMENTFNFSERFVNDFCDEVLKEKLKIYWSVCASFHNIDNPRLLWKMRRAGACRLVFGLETASPPLLRLIEKEITLERVRNVLAWAHQSGIWTGLEIIAGLPHEQIKDVYTTARFIESCAGHLNNVFLNRFHLLYDSPMQRDPEKYGITGIREFATPQNLTKGREEYFRYAFDEINGLKWKEKEKQIEFSFRFMRQVTQRNGLAPRLPRGEELNLLFYLYRHLREKKEIKLYFDKYESFYSHRHGRGGEMQQDKAMAGKRQASYG